MASSVCNNCGELLGEGAKFCSSCGTPADSQAQGAKRTRKDKKPPSWLMPTLIGAGVVAIIVAVMLWVGNTDVQEDLKKQPGQKSAQTPSASLEQDTSTVDTEEGESDSQQGNGGDDQLSSSFMFQTPKTDTETGKETPHSQPDPEKTKTDEKTTTPPPKEVEEPDTTEEKQPEAFEKAFSEGLKAARSGNFELAVLKFQAAVRLSPDNASAWTNLGLTQRKLGDFQGAVESYQNAIKIKPGFALAHKNLGVVLEEMGKLKQAAEAYLKYVELAPGATDATQVKQRAEMLTAKLMRGSGK